LLTLADKKGRFIYEFVEELTEDEMYDWIAYYKEQYDEMMRRRKHA